MNDIETQITHFEHISEKYYVSRQNENHLLFKKLMWDLLFSFIPKIEFSPLYVLEPMCGYAEGKKIIEDHFTQPIIYEGFDLCENILSRIPPSGDMTIYSQDITTFKPKKSYHIIILIGGLHHVPNHVSNILNSLYNALEPDGYFINFEPTDNNLFVQKVREKIYIHNEVFDEKTEKSFDFNEINALYRENGFIIIKQLSTGLLGYTLYYNPDAFPNINLGNCKTVKNIFELEKKFYENGLGKFLSFATLSILKKPKY